MMMVVMKSKKKKVSRKKKNKKDFLITYDDNNIINDEKHIFKNQTLRASCCKLCNFHRGRSSFRYMIQRLL